MASYTVFGTPKQKDKMAVKYKMATCQKDWTNKKTLKKMTDGTDFDLKQVTFDPITYYENL